MLLADCCQLFSDVMSNGLQLTLKDLIQTPIVLIHGEISNNECTVILSVDKNCHVRHNGFFGLVLYNVLV